jgi:hypothetical protein
MTQNSLFTPGLRAPLSGQAEYQCIRGIGGASLRRHCFRCTWELYHSIYVHMYIFVYYFRKWFYRADSTIQPPILFLLGCLRHAS